MPIFQTHFCTQKCVSKFKRENQIKIIFFFVIIVVVTYDYCLLQSESIQFLYLKSTQPRSLTRNENTYF